MSDINNLQQKLNERFADVLLSCRQQQEQITIEITAEHLLPVCSILRDDPDFAFNMLMDVAGVDYSAYGVAQWQTESATATGFERGVESSAEQNTSTWKKPRFAVVYQLLSLQHNQRLRIRTFAPSDVTKNEPPMVDSVISLWQSANWFEREAFDLFGILFKGHPDLRRILTDYGFVGHPFRKDFPVIGQVEVRYDAAQARVIYEPVSIEERILVPRVIRTNSAYTEQEMQEMSNA
jgi:NADH-quinone oxidoreductase subunit C